MLISDATLITDRSSIGSNNKVHGGHKPIKETTQRKKIDVKITFNLYHRKKENSDH